MVSFEVSTFFDIFSLIVKDIVKWKLWPVCQFDVMHCIEWFECQFYFRPWSEQSIAQARAGVMLWNNDKKEWEYSGGSSGISRVHIYHHPINNTYRIVGRNVHDHKVSLQLVIGESSFYPQFWSARVEPLCWDHTVYLPWPLHVYILNTDNLQLLQLCLYNVHVTMLIFFTFCGSWYS